MARYRVVLNTQGYRSVACSKKTWEKGTINDFMRAINGWRTTESSLKEVKWRLSYFAGCTYTTDVWNSTLGCIDPKYEAWIKKRCNKIKYYDILCDMERVSSVQAPGMASPWISMENRFAQTVDSTYDSRLPCGAPRSVSCLCFNVIIISDATENVNS